MASEQHKKFLADAVVKAVPEPRAKPKTAGFAQQQQQPVRYTDQVVRQQQEQQHQL